MKKNIDEYVNCGPFHGLYMKLDCTVAEVFRARAAVFLFMTNKLC